MVVVWILYISFGIYKTVERKRIQKVYSLSNRESWIFMQILEYYMYEVWFTRQTALYSTKRVLESKKFKEWFM